MSYWYHVSDTMGRKKQVTFRIRFVLKPMGVSQVVLVVENPPANAGDMRSMVWSLGQEDPVEESMATHPSILA